jgi:predicted ATPase
VEFVLEQIRPVHFKSYVDETARLAPLTLLLGANASDKGYLLDPLRFVQGQH